MANITSDMVKKLRDATQAGMMDCKKALVETDGDFDQAKDYLRKKGILKADKVSGRETAEGLVYSYIHHNSKLGVLLELNCVTDFVARMEEFKELAHKIALQLAAMGARFISREHVPQEIIDIIERIVESKLESFYKDNCLIEQEYVFESGKTINDLLVELIAKTGENIRISRFVRWQVGESEN